MEKLPFNRGYVRDAEAQQRWCIILPLKNWKFRKKRFRLYGDGKHWKNHRQ